MNYDIDLIQTYFFITVIVCAAMSYVAIMQGRGKLLYLFIFPLFALNMGIAVDLKEEKLLFSILFPLISYFFAAIIFYFYFFEEK